MNYRHIYHAGNLCDVAKHAVLALIVDYLRQKEKGFAVLDTHAGCGLYDLSDPRAEKTGEAQEGILKLWATQSETPHPLLTPYFDVLRTLNPSALSPRLYAGSPLIARRLMRAQDRLIACEKHPEDAASLRRLFRDDRQTQCHSRDGYEALGGLLPFTEKRGLVLIDPPFEDASEIDALLTAAQTVKAKAPNVILALWYPIKDRPALWRFHEGLRAIGFEGALRAEFIYKPETRGDRLNGSGLAIINPPYTLGAQVRTLFSLLNKTLETHGATSLVQDDAFR